QHAHGRAAEAAIEQARREVAALIGALPEEIVFTSGAAEANNLAMRGVAVRAGERRHLVTCAIEHPSVLETCRVLVDAGLAGTARPLLPKGVREPALRRPAVRPDTARVALQSAKHEMGVIQPSAQIARGCRERGVRRHTDAAQAAGRVPLEAAVVDR